MSEVQHEFEGYIRFSDDSRKKEVLYKLREVLEKYEDLGIIKESRLDTYLSRDELERLEGFDR